MILTDITSHGYVAEFFSRDLAFRQRSTLQALEMYTLLRLTEIHIRARAEFLKYAVDREKLVIKQKADSPTTPGVEGTNDGGMENTPQDSIMVEIEEESDEEVSLFKAPDFRDHDYSKHTKMDNMLLGLVDKWMYWVDQKKGKAIDEALLQGLEMF